MSTTTGTKRGNLSLTMACGPYDRTEAIRNGIIKPDGIDLTYVAIESPPVLVDRAVKNNEFDIAEMFLTLYMSLRSQGRFLSSPFLSFPPGCSGTGLFL